MSKKTTSSSAPTNAAAPSKADVVHSEQLGAATPPGSADASAADTLKSDATAGGAGNTAGPAGTAEAIIKVLLEEAGCADPQHLVEMAQIGVKVISFFEDAVLRDGPLKDWPLGDDPAQLVPHLFELVVAAEQKLAFIDSPADVDGKRGFITLKAVHLDGDLTEMHKPLWLTKEQHASLADTEAVDRDWSKGVEA